MFEAKLLDKSVLFSCALGAIALGSMSIASAADLGSVLAQLRQQSPEIRLEQQNVLAAQSDLDSTKASRYPSVTASGSLMRKRVSNVQGRSGTKNVNDLNLEVEQSLFDGFAIHARIAEGENRLAAAQATLVDRVSSTLSNGAQAYLNVLKHRELNRLAKQSIDLAREESTVTAQENAAGASNKKDLLNAQKKLAEAIAKEASSLRQLARAKGRYQRFFGEMPNIDGMEIPRISSALLPASVDELMAAVDRSPAHQAQVMRSKAAGNRINLARAAYYPRVDLNLSHRSETDNIAISATGNVTAPHSGETALSLNMRWELSALLTNENAVNTARATALAEATRGFVTLQRLQGDAVDKWESYQLIVAELDAVTELVNFDNVLIELARQDAASGGGGRLDVLTTEIRSMRNRTRLQSLQIDKLIAEVELAALTGKIEGLVY